MQCIHYILDCVVDYGIEEMNEEINIIDFPVHIAGPLAEVKGITISAISPDGEELTLSNVPITKDLLVKEGDVIFIGTIYSLTIMSKRKYRQFRSLIMKDAFGNNDGTVKIRLPFALVPTGDYQNIDKMPKIGDEVWFFPSHRKVFDITAIDRIGR